MKIAVVTDSLPPTKAGGISAAQYNLFMILKKEGFDVRAFAFADNYKGKSEPDFVRRNSNKVFRFIITALNFVFFKLLDHTKTAYHTSDIIQCSIGSFRLRKHIKAFKPDVLLLSDHCCPGFFIGKIKNCKTILISHHNPSRFLNNPLFGLGSELDVSLAMRFEKKALKNADFVVGASEYTTETFKKSYNYSGPIGVIPNIIDFEHLSSIPVVDIKKEYGLPQESIIVYLTSAGSILKGSAYVYEIVRRLGSAGKNVVFYLSGAISRELEFELEHLKSSVRVIMPGKIDYLKHIGLIKSCSFCISPTLIENFSMALLEACFCGLPVVTFDVGGNKEMIIDNENGFVVDYLDIESLLECSLRLLDLSILDEMRAKTRDSVFSRYNENVILEKYKKVFDFLFKI